MTQDGDSRSPEGLSILLAIEDERWLAPALAPGLGFSSEPDASDFVVRAVRAALAGAGLDPNASTELSVTLADDETVRGVNAEWRGKDKPTNILSFPMADLAPGEPPGPMLGDLLVALETVLREAETENKRPADHLCHLLVHGTLHCLGFDHETEDEAEAMEALEISVLAGLGLPDPYADPAAPERSISMRTDAI